MVWRKLRRNKTVPREITSIFGKKKVVLRETLRPVTPFGGLSVFVKFLEKIGYAAAVAKSVPIQLHSPNAIDPVETFTAFLISVVSGARRFAHTGLLRADRALHRLLGIVRFPTDDTIRNLFKRFTQGKVYQFYSALTRWQIQRLPRRGEGYSLDLDSTVFERYGQQQGALKGPNPRKHGRPSRSEEHTSELQSRLHLVCRLLLEKKKTLPSAPRSPTPDRVVPGIQFSWGRLISRVSSMDTIFAPGRMKRAALFKVAVFPLAVPPQTIIDLPLSTATQRYATISALAVPNLTSSTGVKGFSLYRRIVNDEPRVVTSLLYVAWTRCPSTEVPSRIGFATEICLPHRCPSMTANEFRASSSSKMTLVLIDSNFWWKMKSGMLVPSHETSSILRSDIRTSTGPYQTKSRMM